MMAAALAPTVGGLLEEGACALAAAASAEDARRDAQVLLGHCLGVSRAWLAAHRDDSAGADAAAQFRTLLKQRSSGRPIAYLTGRREFYGREFRVTPDVLIPRPDTETLVEAALARMPRDSRARVLDLGTGSGCIAVTLALERSGAAATGVDVSVSALGVARENAERLGAKVEFVHGEWFDPLAGRRFDLIVSNPPYVARTDPHLQRGDLRFEPAAALAAGDDGLDEVRRIVGEAPRHLEGGGWLLIEHGHDQSAACIDLLDVAGFEEIACCADLAGLPRVSGGRLVRKGSSG